MAEVITGEFSKYRSNLIDAHVSMKVWMWDCGPEEPILPMAPEPPSGKEGDPKYDLIKLQFKRKLKAYETALLKYEQDTVAYDEWQKSMGGPVERLQWSIDAKDTLRYDALAVKEKRQAKPRWYISSRTKGYGHLPNGGLPAGMKPGHGHQANLEREAEGVAEFEAARRADPVFGQELTQ